MRFFGKSSMDSIEYSPMVLSVDLSMILLDYFVEIFTNSSESFLKNVFRYCFKTFAKYFFGFSYFWHFLMKYSRDFSRIPPRIFPENILRIFLQILPGVPSGIPIEIYPKISSRTSLEKLAFGDFFGKSCTECFRDFQAIPSENPKNINLFFFKNF